VNNGKLLWEMQNGCGGTNSNLHQKSNMKCNINGVLCILGNEVKDIFILELCGRSGQRAYLWFHNLGHGCMILLLLMRLGGFAMWCLDSGTVQLNHENECICMGG